MATDNQTNPEQVSPCNSEQSPYEQGYHHGYYGMVNRNPYTCTSGESMLHWGYESGYRKGKDDRDELSRTRRFR